MKIIKCYIFYYDYRIFNLYYNIRCKDDRKLIINNYDQTTDNIENDISEQSWFKSGYRESWYDVFGNKTDNIKYSKDGKIENTSKNSGTNYKSTIGEVNNQEDYFKNERNIYSLYISYSAQLRKSAGHSWCRMGWKD